MQQELLMNIAKIGEFETILADSQRNKMDANNAASLLASKQELEKKINAHAPSIEHYHMAKSLGGFDYLLKHPNITSNTTKIALKKVKTKIETSLLHKPSTINESRQDACDLLLKIHHEIQNEDLMNFLINLIMDDTQQPAKQAPFSIPNPIMDCDWLQIFLDDPLNTVNHDLVLDSKDKNQLDTIDTLIQSLKGRSLVINNFDFYSYEYLVLKLKHITTSLKFRNPEIGTFLNFIYKIADYRLQNSLPKISITLLEADKDLVSKFPDIVKKINEIKPIIEPKEDHLPLIGIPDEQVNQSVDPFIKLLTLRPANEFNNTDLINNQLSTMKNLNNEIALHLFSDKLVKASSFIDSLIELNHDVTNSLYAYLSLIDTDIANTPKADTWRIEELEAEQKRAFTLLQEKEEIIQQVTDNLQKWLCHTSEIYKQPPPTKTRDLGKLHQDYMYLFDYILAINQSIIPPEKPGVILNIKQEVNPNWLFKIKQEEIESRVKMEAIQHPPFSKVEPKHDIQSARVKLKTNCFQFLLFSNNTLDLKSENKIQLLLVLLNIGHIVKAPSVMTVLEENSNLKKYVLSELDCLDKVNNHIFEQVSALSKDSENKELLELIITEEEIAQWLSFLEDPGIPDELLPLLAQTIRPIVEQATLTNNKTAIKIKQYFSENHSEEGIIAKLVPSTALKRPRENEAGGDLVNKSQKIHANSLTAPSFFQSENNKPNIKNQQDSANNMNPY